MSNSRTSFRPSFALTNDHDFVVRKPLRPQPPRPLSSTLLALLASSGAALPAPGTPGGRRTVADSIIHKGLVDSLAAYDKGKQLPRAHERVQAIIKQRVDRN